MIGTDQVVQSSSQAERNTVVQFLNRADVQNQLQSYGIDPASAKDRVAAMTDDEARYLAGRIGTDPAGAMSDGAAVLLVIIIIAVIWWAWKR